MNRKTIILYTLISLIFLSAVVCGLVYLYNGDSGRPSRTPASVSSDHFGILASIPSDATAVFHLESVRKGTELVNDGTKVFSALLLDSGRGGLKSFFSLLDEAVGKGGLSSLKSQKAALSLHYSGSLVPMLAIGAPASESDSSALVMAVRELADSCGLAVGFHPSSSGSVILVSSSETLISSSVRHIDEGMSILSNREFEAALSSAYSKNVLFLSNNYANRLLPAFFQRQVSRNSDFFKGLASWTSISVMDSSEKNLDLRLGVTAGRNSDAFINVLNAQSPETASFPKVIPSGSFYAVSIPFNDQSQYLDAYRKYLDSTSKLAKNRTEISDLGRSAGVDPDAWAKALNVKEVAKALWRGNDSDYEALFVRVGKKDYSLIFKDLDITSEKEYSMASLGNCFAGFPSALFGSLFSLSDESCYTFTGEWLVSGSDASIRDFISRFSEGDVLQSLLSDASVSSTAAFKDSRFVAYYSPSSSKMEEIFASDMLKSVTATLDGASFEPVILSYAKDGWTASVTRVPFIAKSKTPAVVADAAVEVPAGPFKVQNSGTGKTNLLEQQSNYYLSLKEEDGKGIWSIPFSEPLCGYVETIDYFVNGKLQFLFAAGSKLYLLDRLGRFVGGFPEELGKPVLLGPAAYDFSGAHGYSVMVLHTDNTIGMYNIHGVAPESWQGITSDEKIIALPELIKAGGKSYWAVRTAVQTQIFGFYGGEPVYKESGAKSIRRDSEIEVADNGSLKVVCNDGKNRNIKL